MSQPVPKTVNNSLTSLLKDAPTFKDAMRILEGYDIVEFQTTPVFENGKPINHNPHRITHIEEAHDDYFVATREVIGEVIHYHKDKHRNNAAIIPYGSQVGYSVLYFDFDQTR